MSKISTTTTNPTIGLGTKWGWTKKIRSCDNRTIYFVATGLHPHVAALAVRPHPLETNKWTCDLLDYCGIWECYVDGPFNTPSGAARAMVRRYKEDLGKRWK